VQACCSFYNLKDQIVPDRLFHTFTKNYKKIVTMIAHGSHIIIMALLLALQGSSGQRVDVLAAAKPNAVSRGDGSMVREHQVCCHPVLYLSIVSI
jgi:hypothetical protein